MASMCMGQATTMRLLETILLQERLRLTSRCALLAVIHQSECLLLDMVFLIALCLTCST